MDCYDSGCDSDCDGCPYFEDPSEPRRRAMAKAAVIFIWGCLVLALLSAVL